MVSLLLHSEKYVNKNLKKSNQNKTFKELVLVVIRYIPIVMKSSLKFLSIILGLLFNIISDALACISAAICF